MVNTLKRLVVKKKKKQPTISATASWESETFLSKYFPSWSFLLCSHRVTGTGQKHDHKYLLCSYCFENISLLFADSQFWLLCVTPKAWGMKLKISTVLLTTHRQLKKKKIKNFCSLFYYYGDIKAILH